jgi:hypothetical protein
LERKFCRKATYITVPTLAAIKGYYEEFHPRIKVIPQGFRFEDVKLYTGEKQTEKVIFGYGGMFIPGRRDPSEFLDYINNLEFDKPFEFHVYTTTPQFVQPFIKNNDRIILKDLVPREKLLYELSKMDFVVNFENVGSTQTPSKLIDYLIIEKPVLSIKYGNLKKNSIDAFLLGDYSDKMILPDKNNYRIENVAAKFMALIP